MNKKGFANIILVIVAVVVLIGAGSYFVFVRKTTPVVEQSPLVQTQTPTTTATASETTNISQLTKDQVLNGYNQCGQQFKNGTFDFPGTYQEYQKWELSRVKEGKIACHPSNIITADKIVFADLDGDGVFYALAPGRIVDASSGGVLFVFKNIKGIAHVIDMVVFGKVNGEVISVNKNTVVVQTDEWMQYSPEKQTYKFINGKLIKQ